MRALQSPGGFEALLGRGKSFLFGLGERLLVHVLSIIGAGIVSNTVPLDVGWLDSGAVVFTTYMGFICLYPRGDKKSAEWIIPGAAGLSQCVLWAVLGTPWQFTIFFGGLLTWATRLLLRKGKMGWEWAALPWLLLGLLGFFNELLVLLPKTPPFWTLPLLAVAGYGAFRLHQRLNLDPGHRRILRTCAARLREKTTARALPAPLEAPLGRLAEQADRLAGAHTPLPPGGLALARRLETATRETVRLTARANPMQWDTAAGAVFAEVNELNNAFFDLLESLPAPKREEKASLPDDDNEARLRAYALSAEQLLQKRYQLPENLQGPVRGIHEGAGKILACMRDDPHDFAPGDKFLGRYLQAAHTVVDEHIRLAREGAAHEAVARALSRTAELLNRLNVAFQDEHGRLLENDTLNFAVELDVLDKLLKMQGR